MTSKKTVMEKNIVETDPYDLENIDKMIQEKTQLMLQAQNCVQQLQGQIGLLEDMKKHKLKQKDKR